MLEKILYVLAKIVEFLLIIGSVVIVGMVTTEVVMRKFFGSSLIFTEELARYLMVWIVFLGSVLAVRDSAHIRINILVKRFGHRAQQFFALTAYSLTALFLVVLAVQGIKILPQQLWQFCITMDVSLFPFYLAMPVGCILMLLFMIPKVIHVFSGQPLETDDVIGGERQVEEC